MESVRHKNAIAIYLEDYAEDVHIGYITREIQRDRIQETIVKKKAYLEKEKKNIKCMPALIGAGMSYVPEWQHFPEILNCQAEMKRREKM